MTPLIDTHTHLYMADYDPDGGVDQAVRRAIDAGVGHMMMPNVDLASIRPLRAAMDRWPGVVQGAMGLHPTEIPKDPDETAQAMATVKTELDTGRYCAVGEVGVDLYWDQTRQRDQMDVFHTQAQWAAELGLPLVIHCRDGLDQTLEVLSGIRGLRDVVFHSFTGSGEDACRIMDAVPGVLFGINGIITFKKATLATDAVPLIGLDRVLLETDAPFLAPVPWRGRRNESAYLPAIAAKVAQSLGTTTEEVARTTTMNAVKVFRFPSVLAEEGHQGVVV